jgi:predicted nucleic acid-binding protein
MIVLDTNVISELVRSAPAPRVWDWAATVAPDTLATTTVTEAELRFGIATMPDGRRRDALSGLVDELLGRRLSGRVLPLDRAAARHYAAFMASRRRSGRPTKPLDALIAATALAHGATAIATRNTADFEGCGIELIDPWQPAAP